jgi:DNA-directed RNA polymerase sigma subunit (sigma70/sigma32)
MTKRRFDETIEDALACLTPEERERLLLAVPEMSAEELRERAREALGRSFEATRSKIREFERRALKNRGQPDR